MKLTPTQSQSTFRAVLDAMSRPGTIRQLPESECPAVLLPMLTLADLDTGICVLDDDPTWESFVQLATGAPIQTLDAARYVAVLRAVGTDELALANRGTAMRPEFGALVCLSVPDVLGGEPVRITGPGIDGTAEVAPQGFDAWDGRGTWTGAGNSNDFPRGIDLLLVAPDGRVVGIPRTTRKVN